jgi:hypothetical protein
MLSVLRTFDRGSGACCAGYAGVVEVLQRGGGVRHTPHQLLCCLKPAWLNILLFVPAIEVSGVCIPVQRC